MNCTSSAKCGAGSVHTAEELLSLVKVENTKVEIPVIYMNNEIPDIDGDGKPEKVVYAVAQDIDCFGTVGTLTIEQAKICASSPRPAGIYFSSCSELNSRMQGPKSLLTESGNRLYLGDVVSFTIEDVGFATGKITRFSGEQTYKGLLILADVEMPDGEIVRVEVSKLQPVKTPETFADIHLYTDTPSLFDPNRSPEPQEPAQPEKKPARIATNWDLNSRRLR